MDQVYDAIFYDILEHGWTENKDFDRWLDEIFKGEWAIEVHKATELPLGVVVDPRFVSLSTSLSPVQNLREFANLFLARALQFQGRGDWRSSLDQLATVLAISRLAKNHSSAIPFIIGEVIERQALSRYCNWLEKAGPNKELLRAGLEILQRHEAAIPNIENNIKAEYLCMMNSIQQSSQKPNDSSSPPELTDSLLKAASQLPWESQRQDCIFHAVVAAELGFSARNDAVEVRDWEQLLVQPRLLDAYFVQMNGRRWWLSRSQNSQRRLHAAEIATALGIYYADHKKAPAHLGDLAPAYLTSLPIDPDTCRGFGYRFSKGEQIDLPDGASPLQLAPGQAVLIAGEGKSTLYLPAPSWVKEVAP